MKKYPLKFIFVIFCLFFASCSSNKYLNDIETSLYKPELNDTNQLIVVHGYGCSDNQKECKRGEYDKSYADIILLERSNCGGWNVEDYYLGRVGANGISSEKKEGDSKTPIGIFPVLRGFGTRTIDTNIDYMVLNGNEYWVDDVKSKHYNELFIDNGDEKKDFDSAEHLSNIDPEYRYALVIEYNTKEPIKGNGSAIFMHMENNKSTHGCVAVPESGMKKILNWIEPNAHPMIYIMP